MITTVTREQFFTAIADINGMNIVLAGSSADAETNEWIDFNAAKYVEVGDPVYVSAQIALGYTSAQMLALFDAAVQVPV